VTHLPEASRRTVPDWWPMRESIISSWIAFLLILSLSSTSVTISDLLSSASGASFRSSLSPFLPSYFLLALPVLCLYLILHLSTFLIG
jgi:hypothetical protein